MTVTCDCCKRPAEVVSEDALCFGCETFDVFTTIIKEVTDLNNEEALDLASDLSGMVLSAIVERLQTDGHSLLKGLLSREKPN